MKQQILNKKGKKVAEMALPREIFGLEINPDLIYQVVVLQMSNRRIPVADTKDRSEVRGGGRKPWRQKGTGRARHGSIRSPIWKGGGVTFGPTKNRNFKRRIPKRMKKAALLMVLTAKANENLLILLDDLSLEKPKTRLMADVLAGLPSGGKSTLIALPKMNRELIRAAQNIPNVETIQAKDLNCLDLLSFKYLVLPKESIEVIKKTFLRNKGL